MGHFYAFMEKMQKKFVINYHLALHLEHIMLQGVYYTNTESII